MGVNESKDLQPYAEFEVKTRAISAKVYAFVAYERDVPFELQQTIMAQMRSGGCTDFRTTTVFTDPGDICSDEPRLVLLSPYSDLLQAVSKNFWMTWTSCTDTIERIALYNICLPQYAERSAFAKDVFHAALDEIYGRRYEMIAASNDTAVQVGLNRAGFIPLDGIWKRDANYQSGAIRRRPSTPKPVRRSRAPSKSVSAKKSTSKRKSPITEKDVVREIEAHPEWTIDPASLKVDRTRPIARYDAPGKKTVLGYFDEAGMYHRHTQRPKPATCKRITAAKKCGRLDKRFPVTVVAMQAYLRNAKVSKAALQQAFPHGVSNAKRAHLIAYFRKHPRHCERMLAYAKRACK